MPRTRIKSVHRNYVPVYDNESGDELREPAIGDIVLGDPDGVTEVDVRPGGSGKTNLGSSTYPVGDIIAAGEIMGSRLMLSHNNVAAMAASGYLGFGAYAHAAVRGHVAPRYGSIVSLTVSFVVTAFTSGGTARFTPYYSGVPFVWNLDFTVAGLTSYSDYETVVRGTHEFWPDDKLTIYYTKVSGTFTIDGVTANLEIVHDT